MSASPKSTRSRKKWYEETPKHFDPEEWKVIVKTAQAKPPRERKEAFEETFSRIRKILEEVESAQGDSRPLNKTVYWQLKRLCKEAELWRDLAEFTDDTEEKYRIIQTGRERALAYQKATEDADSNAAKTDEQQKQEDEQRRRGEAAKEVAAAEAERIRQERRQAEAQKKQDEEKAHRIAEWEAQKAKEKAAEAEAERVRQERTKAVIQKNKELLEKARTGGLRGRQESDGIKRPETSGGGLPPMKLPIYKDPVTGAKFQTPEELQGFQKIWNEEDERQQFNEDQLRREIEEDARGGDGNTDSDDEDHRWYKDDRDEKDEDEPLAMVDLDRQVRLVYEDVMEMIQNAEYKPCTGLGELFMRSQRHAGLLDHEEEELLDHLRLFKEWRVTLLKDLLQEQQQATASAFGMGVLRIMDEAMERKATMGADGMTGGTNVLDANLPGRTNESSTMLYSTPMTHLKTSKLGGPPTALSGLYELGARNETGFKRTMPPAGRSSLSEQAGLAITGRLGPPPRRSFTQGYPEPAKQLGTPRAPRIDPLLTRAPLGVNSAGQGPPVRTGRTTGTRERVTEVQILEQLSDNMSQLQTKIQEMGRGEGGNIKLTPLKAPKFNGEETAFFSWWVAFQAYINNDPRLSDHHKRQYLLMHLSEDVQTQLGLATDELISYDQCVEIIFNKYGRATRVCRAYRRHIERLPGPAHQYDYKGLDRLVMEIRKGLNALRYFNQGVESVGVSIQDQIAEKLPTAMRAAFASFCYLSTGGAEVEELNLLQLLELLEKWARIQADAQHLPGKASSGKPKDGGRKDNKDKGPSKQEDHTTLTTTTTGERKLVCPLCSGPHYADRCEKYTSPLDVFNRFTELKLCFKCARPGHYSTACTTDRRCFAGMGEKRCQGHHNRALHKYFKEVQQSRRAGGPPQGGAKSQQQSGGKGPTQAQGGGGNQGQGAAGGQARRRSPERKVTFVDEAEKKEQGNSNGRVQSDPANP